MKRTVLLIAAFGLGAGTLLSFTDDQGFPHDRHAGLFPTCEGCHSGISEGDEATYYTVAPEDCATCHDGVRRGRVDWPGPTSRESNLTFTHAEHPGRTNCARCHKTPDSDEAMDVQLAVIGQCLRCHARGAEEHQAVDVDCAKCHLPLNEAVTLTAGRIGSFPQPSDHAVAGFISTHGELAMADEGRCAVCHTADSCKRCHVNADDIEPIRTLAEDARVASLVAGREGTWPAPASHADSAWEWTHGEDAKGDLTGCANCHTQPSCEGCHTESGVVSLDILSAPMDEGPVGVVLADAQPPGHTVDFATRHAAAAVLETPRCEVCHSEQMCVDCHDGSTMPGFHPLNFVSRHAAEAFGRETECVTCHSSEVFCRDCHESLGFTQARRSNAAFHDALAGDWLIAHGRAARQDLESCTTCHQQTTCLRCHSAKTGWGVNPHGADFDAGNAADASTISCGVCHFELP